MSFWEPFNNLLKRLNKVEQIILLIIFIAIVILLDIWMKSQTRAVLSIFNNSFSFYLI